VNDRGPRASVGWTPDASSSYEQEMIARGGAPVTVVLLVMVDQGWIHLDVPILGSPLPDGLDFGLRVLAQSEADRRVALEKVRVALQNLITPNHD